MMSWRHRNVVLNFFRLFLFLSVKQNITWFITWNSEFLSNISTYPATLRPLGQEMLVSWMKITVIVQRQVKVNIVSMNFKTSKCCAPPPPPPPPALRLLPARRHTTKGIRCDTKLLQGLRAVIFGVWSYSAKNKYHCILVCCMLCLNI